MLVMLFGLGVVGVWGIIRISEDLRRIHEELYMSRGNMTKALRRRDDN